MNQNDIRNRLDAYGADPTRWPAGTTLPADVDRVALDEARRLDGLLAALPQVPADSAAVERVMARLDRLPIQRRRAMSFQGWADWLDGISVMALWPRVAALTTASALGVMVGLSDLAAPVGFESEPDLVALVLEQPPVAGLED